MLQSFALLGEFLFHVEKEPKDARGRAQSAVRQASRLHAVRPPGTPIYGSPIRQQLRLSQRRGGTLIDRVSISAAAPFLVAVRWYFYQQTARLLAWWGPSCAVGHAFCHHWSVGSENRGAEVKTQHRKFSTLPGPRWGRVESQGTTQISTRRKVIAAVKGWPP